MTASPPRAHDAMPLTRGHVHAEDRHHDNGSRDLDMSKETYGFDKRPVHETYVYEN